LRPVPPGLHSAAPEYCQVLPGPPPPGRSHSAPPPDCSQVPLSGPLPRPLRRRRPAPGRGHPKRLQVHCSPRSAPLHKTPAPLPPVLLPPPARRLYHRRSALLPRQFPSRSLPPGLLPETLPAGGAVLPPLRPARSPPRSAGSAPEAAPPARRSPAGRPVPGRSPHRSPAALRPVPPYPLRSERARLPVPLSPPVSALLRPPVPYGTVPASPYQP